MKKKSKKSGAPPVRKREDSPGQVPIRLNKFIANSGLCSRREADELIQKGKITVNGKLVKALGTKVNPGDRVLYGSKKLSQEPLTYILLNKPKDFITTTKDPQNRKTIMELVKNATPSRIYPVGRLDRNTTGLLLITNDGDLSKKLSHPSHKVKKIYKVSLNKPLSKQDFFKINDGIELDDGIALVDRAEIISSDNREVGLEIHIGKNRIVRRIFESLGYEVKKLDRVMYAGLTKKDLPRGKWRKLSEREIRNLRHFI